MSKRIQWFSSLFILVLVIQFIIYMPAYADQRDGETEYSTQDEYMYIRTTVLHLQDIFQENGIVYYRLAQPGAIGTPMPVVLPPHIGEKYLICPDSLQKWLIQTYMKQKEVSPGKWVQERKLEFYNQFRQYQGTVYYQDTMPL